MNSVSLVTIHGNTIEAMKQAILESLNLIDYSFKKEIKNVVIKPNMCYYWDYSTGQTTDPKFVAALISLIREKTSQTVHISVVESDATAMKCKYVFKMLGYERLSLDYDVKLINLSEDESDTIDMKIGGHSFHLMLPRSICNANLKINVPKIKYATEEIKLTCALKNIFGCNPYPKKFRYHSSLAEAIVAINKAMNFDLCLIDGNVVSGVQPRRLGLAMASKDPVAIDTAAARIAGLAPEKIQYLGLAQKEGLGSMFFTLKGESLSYFRDRYPRLTSRGKLTNKAYALLTRAGIGAKIGLR